MTTLQKVLLTLAFSLTFLGFVLMSNKGNSFGSVSVTSEYQATSTRNGFDGTALPTDRVLVTGPGTLGSVVILGAATGVINLYDATSSAQHTDYATTTIVAIPASLAAGTYTFDLVFKRGLMYEVVGTAPTSTITFRK